MHCEVKGQVIQSIECGDQLWCDHGELTDEVVEDRSVRKENFQHLRPHKRNRSKELPFKQISCLPLPRLDVQDVHKVF